MEDFINYFEERCEHYEVLFLPDPARQEKIARQLVNLHGKTAGDKEVLYKAVDLFIQESQGTALIYDFAIESSKYRDKILVNKESHENFNKLLKETEKRMQEFKGVGRD